MHGPWIHAAALSPSPFVPVWTHWMALGLDVSSCLMWDCWYLEPPMLWFSSAPSLSPVVEQLCFCLSLILREREVGRMDWLQQQKEQWKSCHCKEESPVLCACHEERMYSAFFMPQDGQEEILWGYLWFPHPSGVHTHLLLQESVGL